MPYIHQCYLHDDGSWDEDAGGTEIEVLAVVPATLRTSVFGDGRRFWLNDTSDLSEDAQGVMVSSIYCSSCEKFVVSLDTDSLNGTPLTEVEDKLEEGAYAGIVYVEG